MVIYDDFLRLKEKVLIKRPILAEVVRKNGEMKLYDYANEYIHFPLNSLIKNRQNEFLSSFRHEVAKLLGDSVAEGASRQLAKYYFASTADHQGPICHPFFLNSNLLTAIPYADSGDSDLKYVIVFSCANISLSNSSYPRGLLFNSFSQGKNYYHRLPFLPSNAHSSALYNFRPYKLQEVQKVKNLLNEKVASQEILEVDRDKIDILLDEIYSCPDVLACQDFSQQLTKTNFYLWKKFFHKTSLNPPDLIYLEQESLAITLLLDHHLFRDTIIHQFLFNEEYQPLIMKYFEGIMGAFSHEHKSGTYFFWGISKENNSRISLLREGNFLVSYDRSFKIELTPEALKKGLEEKVILPSQMLIFILLSCYYGVKCLGGYNQIHYLTSMKEAYITILKAVGDSENIDIAYATETKTFVADLMIAFLKDQNNRYIPATGLDLILHGSDDMWGHLIEETKRITLDEALNPMMPDFYTMIYPQVDREAHLTAITPEAITQLTSLDKKIFSCSN